MVLNVRAGGLLLKIGKLKGKKMSRKGRAPIREVPADPIYNSKLVTKLINKLMYAGQRGKAEKIFFIMP